MKKAFKIILIVLAVIIGLPILLTIIALLTPESKESKAQREQERKVNYEKKLVSEIKNASTITVLEKNALKLKEKYPENPFLDSIGIYEKPLKEKEEKRKAEILKQRKSFDLKVKSLRKNTDEFNKTSFYYSRKTTQYNNVNSVHLYLVKTGDNNEFYPRFVIQYEGESWLFIESCDFLIDGQKMSYYPKDMKRDNNTRVWEWTDDNAGVLGLDIATKIANSKSAKIRYNGSQYYKDRVISNNEKLALKEILEVYELSKKL